MVLKSSTTTCRVSVGKWITYESCPQTNYSAHVLALTATWAKEDIIEREFEIPGYTLFRKDRGNKGGGIAIHARDDLIVTRRDDLETSDVEGLWLEFIFQSRKFFFWNVL